MQVNLIHALLFYRCFPVQLTCWSRQAQNGSASPSLPARLGDHGEVLSVITYDGLMGGVNFDLRALELWLQMLF